MSQPLLPLLLDEMLSDDIGQELRAKGYDVTSVVADPALIGLPDDQVLAYATPRGERWSPPTSGTSSPWTVALVAAGQPHAGLILVSTKTFPQNRGFAAAITASLATLLSGTAKIQAGQVLFLIRG